jgi:hypothetical protein
MLQALKLQKEHPIANYRYAHLMFADKEYALAAYYFKRAMDGSPEKCLDDTQMLIANIITVNCGMHMAKAAIIEINDLHDEKEDHPDQQKRQKFLDSLLVDSEERLEQHMYRKVTPIGQQYISHEQYFEEMEETEERVVKMFVSQRDRFMVFQGGHRVLISQTEFYVAHTILMSYDYLDLADIGFMLNDLEKIITSDYIRQSISRLKNKAPFWDDIVDSITGKNSSKRRRRSGIHYALLCHSSVMVPSDSLS